MNNKDRQENIKKLGTLIKGIRFAMLTTEEEDGCLRSRPMATQSTDFDGTLWFFTDKDSPKVHEVEHHHKVNLSYADPDRNTYVSISGTATLVKNKKKIEELWNPMYKTWFPEGLNDPRISLLKVEVDKAEYWDSTSNKMVMLAGFLKSVITGKRPTPGEHEKVKL